MAIYRVLPGAFAVISLLAGSGDLLAQVPPHRPGTVCVVDAKTWCWASPPGRAGDACTCRTPLGSRTGTLN
jgi:hypothetical protein